MKVHEAITAVIGGEMWARPLSWRGFGIALHVYNHCRVAVVPSPTGGKTWNCRASDLMEDWEVVDPDVVLDEAHPSVW